MNFFKKLKSRVGIALSVLSLSAVLVSAFAPALKVNAADAPRFNFMQGDYELLRGANKSEGQTAWVDPVSGKAGDEFAGVVYIHNGNINSTAQNVRVKVSIPSETTNKTAVLTASVSADNAPTITNTVVDGQIVGSNGLTVNLDQDANISFVPGSVKWFPDFTDASNPDVTLPFSQSGDEIITGNGVNLGNMAGCWEHIAYVSFRFRTTAKVTPAPSMTVTKYVRNVTMNETIFVKENVAKPGETLEYKVSYTNTSAVTADNVYLIDAIPVNTSYVAGSTKMEGVNTLPDGIVGNSINVGPVSAGASGFVTFRVKISSGVASGEVLVNTVSLIFNKQTLTDTAKTRIYLKTPVPTDGKDLPQTGAETPILATLIAGGGATLRAFWLKKKALAAALKNI